MLHSGRNAIRHSLRRLLAPMSMVQPSALLALFAAILGSPATSALGKLSCELFPLAALVVRALSDTSAGVVFAAEISHDYSGPVLHVRRVMANRKLLDQGENVEIVILGVLLH